MAEFTPNYRLHQWEPTDPFLREDFNRDFAAIDTALGRAERSTEANAYNVYNLVLQNDYERKYTGYKKALLFDGFLDESGIAEKSETIQSGSGRLVLSGLGEEDRVMGYGSVGGIDLTTETYTATGNGQWTGCTCQVKNSMQIYSTLEFTYTVTVNGQTVLTGRDNKGSVSYGNTREWDVTFSRAVDLAPGDTFQLKLQTTTSYMALYYQTDNLHLGGTLHITPKTGDSGQVTTVSGSLPACQEMRAYLRHTGGTVALTRVTGEGEQAFLQTEQRQTVTLDRKACTETEFRLEGPFSEGNAAFRLDLERTEDEMSLFDYGIVLM